MRCTLCTNLTELCFDLCINLAEMLVRWKLFFSNARGSVGTVSVEPQNNGSPTSSVGVEARHSKFSMKNSLLLSISARSMLGAGISGSSSHFGTISVLNKSSSSDMESPVIIIHNPITVENGIVNLIIWLDSLASSKLLFSYRSAEFKLSYNFIYSE